MTPQMIKSDSGATMTCSECGTVYDNYGVDIEDYVPPYGDGCNFCMSDESDEDVGLQQT